METKAHIEFLRREGCLQVQGFFFGKPGPLNSIANLVDDTFLSVEEETDVSDGRRYFKTAR